MANSKITDFSAGSASSIAADDVVEFVDLSDTSMDASGTNKKLALGAIALCDGGAKTSSFTAVAGERYRLDMSSAGADLVVTFPATPSNNDRFMYELSRASGTYNLTINRNGSNVYGGTNVALYTQNKEGYVAIWRYDATSSGQGWVLENPPRINVQEFAASGTWVKPPGAKMLDILLIGGGGGGGSGRRGAAGTARLGGSGGAAGTVTLVRLPASLFSSTETVTVGAGGPGGNAQTVDDTNGNAGTAGGDTTFGSTIAAKGSAAGVGGTNSNAFGAIGGGGQCFFGPLIDNFGSTSGGGGNAQSGATPTYSLPSGGGGGGTLSVGNASLTGGGGGQINTGNVTGSIAAAAGGLPGVAGTNGTSYTSSLGACIGGGGGGGGTSANGGNGGNYGGGGGGGGASLNGTASGAGGNGGGGYALIITYCG
jgi:hypothetical protein